MTSATFSLSADVQFVGSSTTGLRLGGWVEHTRRYFSDRSAGSAPLAEALQERVPSSVSFAQTKAPEKLTESDLRELAATRTALLIHLVESGRLRPAQLAFAASALGGAPFDLRTERTLCDLLGHSMPMVREGAVYGFAQIGSASARRQLAFVAESDTSPGVREAAEEALDE